MPPTFLWRRFGIFFSLLSLSLFIWSCKSGGSSEGESDKIHVIENNSSDNEIVVSSENNVDENLMRNFDNYPSFEESIKPDKQLQNLLTNTDRELKKSVFRLWETYEKEMSKQIGSDRLNGSDIDNTFNDSLNSLSK